MRARLAPLCTYFSFLRSKLLSNCYQMRCDDDYTWGGGDLHGPNNPNSHAAVYCKGLDHLLQALVKIYFTANILQHLILHNTAGGSEYCNNIVESDVKCSSTVLFIHNCNGTA
jgi:hypothetical protein